MVRNNMETNSLKNIITPSRVQSKVTVNSWLEAIDYACGLLEKEGLVLPSYIVAIKNTFKTIGAYMVIAPGIVLLHSRPEDGVLKPCLALITLNEPICFGHPDNDPVDIVFAMGATDKNTHIQALQHLAELLGNPQTPSLMRSIKSDEDLYKLLTDQKR